MKSTQKQAIDKLNDLLSHLRDYSGQEIKNNVQILVQGINELDQEVKQKTFEVQNREQLLVQRDNLLVQKDGVINQKTAEVQSTKQVLAQKEQKLGELEEKEFVRGKEELIDVLPKLYPNMYPPEYENWPNDWGRTVIDRKDITSIEEYLPNFKMQLLKNELIDILPKLFPNMYPVNYENWPQDWGRTVIENNDIKSIEKHLPNFRQQLVEKLNRSVLIEKADKEGEIARLKELLSMQELEAQNKNQVIGELKEDIGLKEKETLNLKIESLMKQVEFHKKESELKDKALEDALEIGKQNKIINELQEKLLAFKNLSQHDETLQLELSVIHFKVEESIVNGNLDEMKELSKYLSQLMKDPIEKEESLDISELLNNLSPIVHGGENHIQNPVPVINNFDINNIHTTHSVLVSVSGEGSESFTIIDTENFH